MDWFTQTRQECENKYLPGTTPWEQSGMRGSYERWRQMRSPVADAVSRSGSFLDIGCANGYLLESLQNWLKERNLSITPFGMDLSQKLIALALKRLPEYASNFWTANCLEWTPPIQFDYVRVELGYVPAPLRQQLYNHLMRNYVAPGGQLLIAEYRPTNFDHTLPWLYVALHDLEVEACYSGWENEVEMTRVVSVQVTAGAKSQRC